MAVFVLVHGGWGGGWEWAEVSRRLAVGGHEVYRPTLTGCGERSHLISASVDLDTHIEDVLGLLWYEDLRDVILVGQSAGGSVATGVADRAPERVRRIVYVEGFALGDGEAMVDALPAEFVAALRESAIDGYRLPLPFSPAELEIEGSVGRWYVERLGFHPLGAFEQPLRLTGAVDRLARSYVRCSRNVELEHYFTRFVERAHDEGWDYRVVDAPHDAQIAEPQAVLDAYLAAGPRLVHVAGDRAAYQPATDTIRLPQPAQFRTPQDYYGTAFHEAGHSTGHPSRLNRPGITSFDHFGSGRYAREELAAEMTSALLCAQTGIDTPAVFDNSASYIAGWLTALDNDHKLVITAAAQAQHASDLISQPERQPAIDASQRTIAAEDEAGPAAGSTAALAVPVPQLEPEAG